MVTRYRSVEGKRPRRQCNRVNCDGLATLRSADWRQREGRRRL